MMAGGRSATGIYAFFDAFVEIVLGLDKAKGATSAYVLWRAELVVSTPSKSCTKIVTALFVTSGLGVAASIHGGMGRKTRHQQQSKNKDIFHTQFLS